MDSVVDFNEERGLSMKMSRRMVVILKKNNKKNRKNKT
jgi:hypothetical protein